MAAKKKTADENNTEKKLSIEESFEQLEEIIEKLSDSDISLSDSFELYSKGMKMVKECSGELDEVEKKVMALSDDGTLEEFE